MATTVAQHTVATFTSPVNGTTPIDANTVRGNDNTIRSSYNDHDSDPGIHVQSSTLASRPAAGTAGRKWITADAGEYKLWYDDGTRWNEVGNDAVDVSFIADGNIVKGDVLKLTGWNNGQNLPTLGPATVSGDICFAIATETVSNGDRSFAINTGFLEDVDTSAFSTGDILYPSNGAGPGTITSWFQSTKPTSGNYQLAAYVIRDNASNGVLFVEFSGPRIVERSDNTASTVVLRDGSGNFSAGTVSVGALTSTGLVTFASLKGTGATTVTNILDEDNMASNSDTALATQQSIKAYVDSQVTAQDLDFAGDSGVGAVDLDSQSLTIAGTANEIVTAASGQTLTIGLPSSITVNVVGNLTGNADTATKLSSSRTFALTGDVTGSVSSDLTSGASISTSIAAGAIVDADINAAAAISLSKLATGALPTGITVASANIVDGTIVNADISASAEIAVSKLADGSARQLLQTDAAGTGVEWTSNVDVPGTLDVTGATTLDSTLTVTGDANFDSGTLFVDVSTNRVGIGTTSPSSALQINAVQTLRSVNDSALIEFYNTANTVRSGYLQMEAGDRSSLWVAINEGLRFGTNDQERMRIDSSGRVGIGTTSPGTPLHVTSGTDYSTIRMSRSNSTNTTQRVGLTYPNYANNAEVGVVAGFDDGSNASVNIGLVPGSSGASSPTILSFWTTSTYGTAGSERMRITSGGFLKASATNTYYNATGLYHELRSSRSDVVAIVSNTDSSNPYGIYNVFTNASPDNNTNYFFLGADSTTNRIFIYSDGDLANHDGVYGTISDEKLKQDIVDATSQWNDIKAIRFRKYRMKTDVEADADAPYLLGVVAQELEQTSPGLIDQHPDMETVQVPVLDEDGNETGEFTQEQRETGEYTKTVKSSILLMKAAKALQEAMERIETLEAKVAQLENA